MAKTKIEWLRDPVSGKAGFSINPVKGLCPIACDYCYARRMYKRFKWNPEIRFEPSVYNDISVSPRGQRIFVGSTIELFGDWVRQEWLNFIIKQCYVHPWHTFIFLTKCPQNLKRWEFPNNCWVGVTITDGLDREGKTPLRPMLDVQAKNKFISFEPLLNWGNEPRPDALAKAFQMAGISWVIIGQLTPGGKATMPKIEWINEIVEAADKAKIPVFLKNNLLPLFNYPRPLLFLKASPRDTLKLRQEFPEGG